MASAAHGPATVDFDRGNRWLASTTYTAVVALAQGTTLQDEADDPAISRPRRTGCSRHWCEYEAVCLSNRDGVLVPNVSTIDPTWRQSFDPIDGWRINTSKGANLAERLMPVWRLQTMPPAAYHTIRGRALVFSCWHQLLSSANPSHLMHGYGWLLQAVLDLNASRGRAVLPFRSIDTLVFHQCPRHADSSSWSFARGVWRLLGKFAAERGLLRRSLRHTNVITLGARRRDHFHSKRSAWINRRWMTLDDTVVCFEHAHVPQRRSINTWLGREGVAERRAWQQLVAGFVSSIGLPANGSDTLAKQAATRTQSAVAGTSRTPSTTHSCDRAACAAGLRVAIWRRGIDGAGGSRNFANIDALVALVRRFTRVEARVITASRETSFEEQVRLFQSFDILITPHGSQLTTLLVAPPSVVVIEVQPTHYDGTFCKNAGKLVAAYIMSYGHTPTAVREDGSSTGTPDARLLAFMNSSCGRNLSLPCERNEIKKRDVLVNTTQLRRDLERAVGVHCACSKAERARATRRAATRRCLPNANLAHFIEAAEREKLPLFLRSEGGAVLRAGHRQGLVMRIVLGVVVLGAALLYLAI